MALTRLPNPSTWFSNVLVSAAAIKSNIVDLVNEAIDLLNSFQGDTVTDTIPIMSAPAFVTGTATFTNPYPAGTLPIVIPAVYIRSSGAYPSGYQGAIGVQVLNRTNVGFDYRIFTSSGAAVSGNPLPVAIGYMAAAL